jgi:hypothetical protein
VVQGVTVGGATEKDILRDPATDNWYIAKLGQRNNDLEVVTEYLIYLIGRNIGAGIAEAKLATFRGKLRFLSKYFLDRTQRDELVHGVQLFKELYDERAITGVLRNQPREQEMFSLQAIRNAFGAHYVEYGLDVERSLFSSLVEMVVHDAIIGVQDRHHENWGVVVRRGKAGPPPRFSPLFDSARGLFCNESDEQLKSRMANRDWEQWLDGYIARSRPLMGWDGLSPARGRKLITHDQLVAAVYRDEPGMRPRIQAILSAYDWKALRDEIKGRVGPLCSGLRLAVILTLLRRRIALINRAISGP